MIVLYSHRFNKSFSRRIKSNSSLTQRTVERIRLFVTDPKNEILKNHKLSGNKVGLFSFSINGDYRIIYQVIDVDTVKFIDIGTHNQVYSA
ncbi:MAG: type II toxin-antitoxin system mRNA interferase toxin, RelE/StbE family [Candidatus Shapirobacteria bacterium]|jgi:addiction module RelE/StbE family toxin